MADLMTESGRIKTASPLTALVLVLAWESLVPYFSCFARNTDERMRHGLRNLVLGVLNSLLTGLLAAPLQRVQRVTGEAPANAASNL